MPRYVCNASLFVADWYQQKSIKKSDVINNQVLDMKEKVCLEWGLVVFALYHTHVWHWCLLNKAQATVPPCRRTTLVAYPRSCEHRGKRLLVPRTEKRWLAASITWMDGYLKLIANKSDVAFLIKQIPSKQKPNAKSIQIFNEKRGLAMISFDCKFYLPG